MEIGMRESLVMSFKHSSFDAQGPKQFLVHQNMPKECLKGLLNFYCVPLRRALGISKLFFDKESLLSLLKVKERDRLLLPLKKKVVFRVWG